jgi:hypothetical protein
VDGVVKAQQAVEAAFEQFNTLPPFSEVLQQSWHSATLGANQTFFLSGILRFSRFVIGVTVRIDDGWETGVLVIVFHSWVLQCQLAFGPDGVIATPVGR